MSTDENARPRLDEIEARADAATEGPWEATWGDREPARVWIEDDFDEPLATLDVGAGLDAEFIAHARSDVPALLAEVERLRASADEWWRLYDEQLAEVERLRAATVKPDREDIYRAWHGTDDPWAGCADSASIERVLALLPGRTEAEVKAETWDEAVDTLSRHWEDVAPAAVADLERRNPYRKEADRG